MHEVFGGTTQGERRVARDKLLFLGIASDTWCVRCCGPWQYQKVVLRSKAATA